MNEYEKDEAAAIAAEFPGWEAWCGLNRLWHARRLGSTPPQMVHGNNPADIREQIRLWTVEHG